VADIPTIGGRPIFEVIDAQDDPRQPNWERNKGARWIPGLGWCFHEEGERR
jgi:hypothetical protein